MFYKILIFIIIQLSPLAVWACLLKRKGTRIDWRLLLSYFVFGSWFGAMGELFLYKLIDVVFHAPIWQYKTLPIHHGVTSSLGPIMWGIAAVYVGFHKNYPLFPTQATSPIKLFLRESGFLLVLELIFNFVAFGLFGDYFFYYFVPDLGHWSSFTNLPMWWLGYKALVRFAGIFYKEEKLNICLAVIMITVLFSYQ